MPSMLTIELEDPIFSEARKRGMPDRVTEKLIKEFEEETWRFPLTFYELLEVVE